MSASSLNRGWLYASLAFLIVALILFIILLFNYAQLAAAASTLNRTWKDPIPEVVVVALLTFLSGFSLGMYLRRGR
jgi:uncharacterized integral membrane protein